MCARVLGGAIAVVLAAAASAETAGPPEPVTPPGFSDVHSFQPAWSPDGTRLALVRSFSRTTSSEVVVMNVDRSHARRIRVGWAPAWSPDSRRIVFVERGANEARYLTVAAADGSGSRRLLRIDANGDDRPAWSPDGRLIAFRTGIDISVVRADGHGLRILVRGAAWPDWSPDGRLVFVTTGNLQCCHLEVAAADGTGRIRLEGAEPRGGIEPRWSPDGRRISFVAASEHGDRSVYVMDADGTDPVQVTPNGFEHPTWAPDSQRLAVSSDEGEIYLVDLQGSPPHRLTFGGCTMVGTDGADVLTGGPADGVICGFGGDDVIRGGEGDDRIVGGAGNDRIQGGRGGDTIFGEEGNDVLEGGPGRDSIHGDAGRDLIDARDGEVDLVDGGGGADRATADARDCLLEIERRGSGVRSCEPNRNFAVTLDPAWSPDGKRIAFVNQVGTVGTLYVVNTDGSGLRRVTGIGFDARWPSWSQDGRRIAFHHIARTATGTTSGIYVIDTDRRRLRHVISPGVQPAWGPAGGRIAFSGSGYRILTVSPSGGGLRQVADPGPETGGEGSCKSNGFFEPTWSPDGEFVAFSVAPGEGGECGFDVYIGASRGNGKVKVLASCWCEQPDWSADGKRLALVRYPPEGGEPYYTIAIADVQTGRPLKTLRSGWHPRWSPDGRRLVFVDGDPFASHPRSRIYTMDADGSHVRRLTP